MLLRMKLQELLLQVLLRVAEQVLPVQVRAEVLLQQELLQAAEQVLLLQEQVGAPPVLPVPELPVLRLQMTCHIHRKNQRHRGFLYHN